MSLQRLLAFVALAPLVVLASPAPVGAQTFESVGNRAQGMGGAFVAVADDATLTWWNPGGLATGGQLSVLFEQGKWDDPAVYPATGPATRNKDTAFALVGPGLGISYYRVSVTDLQPLPAAGPAADDSQ